MLILLAVCAVIVAAIAVALLDGGADTASVTVHGPAGSIEASSKEAGAFGWINALLANSKIELERTEDSSMDTGTLAVLLALGIPMIAVAGGILLAALRILKGESGGRAKSGDAEEARMIQDIYHGLLKMESRVESLETLLMDRQRKGNNQ